jgi:hypothetical protein
MIFLVYVIVVEMYKSCIRLKYKKHVIHDMSMTAWKCYQCNLTFKDASHVVMHKEISHHDARKVEIAA